MSRPESADGLDSAATGRPIVVVGLREAEYTRNAVVLQALSDLGFAPRAFFPRGKNYVMRLAWLIVNVPRIAWAARGSTPLFACFLAQPVVLLLAPFVRGPIVMDFFISVFDTLVCDRGQVRPDSLSARLALALDRAALHRATAVVVDTNQGRGFVADLFPEAKAKIFVLPVGADERIFYARHLTRKDAVVFWYTTGARLHGAAVVLEAAKILEGIAEFRIAGALPAAELPTNVVRLGWLSVDEIAAEASQASVCLAGHFHGTPKAQRVVPGKAFQFMALESATVLSRLAANQAAFPEGAAIWVEADSAISLASAVRNGLAGGAGHLASIAKIGHDGYLALGGRNAQRDTMRGILIFSGVANVPGEEPG